MNVSVFGFVSFGKDTGRKFHTYGASDYSVPLSPAPSDELIKVHDYLFGKLTGILSLFELGFGPSQPLVMLSCEVGTDGTPSLPILTAVPRNNPTLNLHDGPQVEIIA